MKLLRGKWSRAELRDSTVCGYFWARRPAGMKKEVYEGGAEWIGRGS